MSQYRPYPNHKNSGITWPSRVPEHWQLRKVGWDMKMTIGWTPATSRPELYDGTNNWVSIADMTAGRILETKSKISNQAIKEKGAVPAPVGSVLFSYKLSVGEVAVLEMPAYTNEAIAAFHPSKIINAGYWKYAATVILPYAGRVNIYGALLLNQELMAGCRFFCPVFSEQKQLADSLDRETARIDSLIEKKARFIELLKEKRQALITQAVTKGLDPNVPMRDSGVEWIGAMPEHWEIKKLKYTCRIRTGNRDTAHAVDEGEYPFYVRSQIIEHINSYSADCEAVLTAGDGAGVGKVFHYAKGKFDFHQRVYMFNRFVGVAGRFFYYYVASNFYKVAMDGGAKTSVDSLRLPLIANFDLTLPAKKEQLKICEYLDAITEKMDLLLASTERSIVLLKERRSALITAAVTGQIDLREAS